MSCMGIPTGAHKLIVAGDDVVFWIKKDMVPDLHAQFRLFFKDTSSDPTPHGFG